MWNSEFESASVSTKQTFFLLIALVAMIALSIRYTIATGDSLWLDELHTAWTVNDGFAQVATRATDGNQNPFFFWLTWICSQVLESNQLALRLVSIVAGTGVAAVAGWFTWRASRSVAGVLITSLIITLDWRFVFYSTEARPYALMQLLGLLHAAIFASLLGLLPSGKPSETDRSLKWSALTLLSIALFYCHITSVWLFAAESIILLLLSTGLLSQKNGDVNEVTSSALYRPLLLSLSAAFVGCLPGVLNLTRVFGRKSNWSDLSSPAGVLSDAFEPLLFWMGFPLLLFTLGWLMNKFIFRPKSFEQKDLERNNFGQVLFVLAWAITPIAGVVAVDYLRIAPLALSRYAVVGTPAMAIFAGLMIGRTPGVLLKIIAITLIALASYTNNEITRQLVDRQTLPVLRNEDWNSPTDRIEHTELKRTQPVLLFANVIEDADAGTNLDPQFQDYLRFPTYRVKNLTADEPRVFSCPTHQSPRLTNALVERVISEGGAWLLIRGSDATVQSIVNEVEQTLSEHVPDAISHQLRIEERDNDGDVVHLFSVDLL